MNGMHVGLAMLASAVGVSLADWFFFAVLFHEKYKAYPEVWRRPEGGAGQGRAIGLSALTGLLTPIVFVWLCTSLGVVQARPCLLLAVSAWAMACFPMLVGSYLFIKTHPLVFFAHSLGWLVKLLIPAAAVAWLLP